MDRRQFLKKNLLTFGLLSAGRVFSAGNIFTEANEKSKVVICRDNSVRIKQFSYDKEKLSLMLDKAMNGLYGTKDAIDAWKMVVSPSDAVGLKVNCLSGKRMSTSVELVEVVISKLQRAGVRKENIIIWDRMNIDLEKAGFKINTRGSDVKCFGNDAAGFENELSIYGEIGSLLSRTLTDYCSVIIDMPVLKDHGIVGVTISLKNFFGSIHNPNKYHEKLGDPYVADLWLVPDVKNKTKLIICDALTAQFEGGPPYKPQWIWDYSSILVGKDPVALDYVGWHIIEDKRKERGLKSLKDVGREPSYIKTAGDSNHQIGIADPDKIDLILLEKEISKPAKGG